MPEEPSNQEAPPKRGPGRPKGSKNRTKEEIQQERKEKFEDAGSRQEPTDPSKLPKKHNYVEHSETTNRKAPKSTAKRDRTTIDIPVKATDIEQYQRAALAMGPLMCGAKRRGQDLACKLPAGWGTSHPGYGYCRRHGGNTPGGIAFAEKMMVKHRMRQDSMLYGQFRDIGPHEALLEEVQRTAGHVTWLQQQIASLPNLEALVQDSAKDGRKPDALHQMYMEERKHLVNVCKAAISVGIEERKVKLAEEQGKIIATMFVMLINDESLELSSTQRLTAQKLARDLLLQIPAEANNTMKAIPKVTSDGKFVDTEGYDVKPIIDVEPVEKREYIHNPAAPNAQKFGL